MTFDPDKYQSHNKPWGRDEPDSARRELRKPGENDPRGHQKGETGPTATKARFLTLPVSAAFRWIRGRLS